MQYDRCPCGKRKFGHGDTHAWRENNVKRLRETMAIHKPWTEAWNTSFLKRNRSCQPFDFRLSGLQHCETINVYCLSHPVYGTWLWQPEQMNTVTIRRGMAQVICYYLYQTWRISYTFILSKLNQILDYFTNNVAVSVCILRCFHRRKEKTRDTAGIIHKPDSISKRGKHT